MGSFLDKPKTEKTTDRCEGNELRCGVSEMQGWRVDMEDAHSTVPVVAAKPEWSWFAVFDGHGGSLISLTAAERLLPKICADERFEAAKTAEEVSAIMRDSFIKLDEDMKTLPAIASGEDHSGSTAITAMVTPTHIIVGNCGDSRAVLSRVTAGAPVWGSEDHKPNNEPEQKRIEAGGGSVVNRRVNGDLAVSRAFGDFLYKHRQDLPPEAQQVTVEPECTIIPRSDDLEYLILCCDGIWDVMSNEEVVEFVRTTVMGGEPDLGTVSEMLIDKCLKNGSRDNMSALIVSFKAAKQPSEDVVAAFRKRAAEEAAAAEARAAEEDGAGGGAGRGY